MSDRFRDKSCVFCSKASVGTGEHVWPKWFIGEFRNEGPFTTYHAEIPYTKRDGQTPVTSDALLGVHVPACTDCNSTLNTTLEEPAKPIVRRILNLGEASEQLVLTADECAALGRWLLKVGLLSAHPDADHDHRGLQCDPDLPRIQYVQPEWMEWMRTGGDPSAGFSVFITRRNLRDGDMASSPEQHIMLPQLYVDGSDCNFMSLSFGFTGVTATIVWHPGWPIVHAQVGAGRAVRLWPDSYEVDFGSLPQVHPRELTFRDATGPIMDIHAHELPQLAQYPLRVDADLSEAYCGIVFSPEQ